MAGAQPGTHALKLKPLTVPDTLKNGSRFMKWDDDLSTVTPITPTVDPHGYFLHWTDQNKETEFLDITHIKDARTGKSTKTPKEAKLRELLDVGNLVGRIENRLLTIVTGPDMVNITYLNFMALQVEEATEWAEELFSLASNLLSHNMNRETSLEKAYVTVTLQPNSEGRIPVKKATLFPLRTSPLTFTDLSSPTYVLGQNSAQSSLSSKYYQYLLASTLNPDPFSPTSVLDQNSAQSSLSSKYYQYLLASTLNPDPFSPTSVLDQNSAQSSLSSKYYQYLLASTLNPDPFSPTSVLDQNSAQSSLSSKYYQYLLASTLNPDPFSPTSVLDQNSAQSSLSSKYYQYLLASTLNPDPFSPTSVLDQNSAQSSLSSKYYQYLLASTLNPDPFSPTSVLDQNSAQSSLSSKYYQYLLASTLNPDPFSPTSVLDQNSAQSSLSSKYYQYLLASTLNPDPFSPTSVLDQNSAQSSLSSKYYQGAKGAYLSVDQMTEFINERQRDPRLNEILYPPLRPSQIQTLMEKYELNQSLLKQGLITLEGFSRYLVSDENGVIPPEKLDQSEDMTFPLSHYFINSSHNTYLTVTCPLRYNKQQLSRIYPKGTRVDSSNYMPQLFWNAGCQLVALNFQTIDLTMQLNLGMYEYNGKSGYRLKPEFMRRPDKHFDPFAESTVDGIVANTVKIISGQFLSDKKVGVYIELDMFGLPVDTRRKALKTKTSQSNAINPVWDEEPIIFKKVVLPTLASLRIAAFEEEGKFIGHRIIPVPAIRPGYRYIGLRNEKNQSLILPAVFVYIEVKDYVPDTFADVIEALSNPIRYVNLLEQRSQQLAALTLEEGEEETSKEVEANADQPGLAEPKANLRSAPLENGHSPITAPRHGAERSDRYGGGHTRGAQATQADRAGAEETLQGDEGCGEETPEEDFGDGEGTDNQVQPGSEPTHTQTQRSPED
ncbi:1-phosphatidylinositol 4,5-bisphosphate phosphodiesterase beta-1 [Salmo salar]|uniref:phosphoinositide phospholipase C n=1 Tax=Salmo salar TaxID=8030 RepID=A0ABM3FAE0_SALSA|nr:1-phosphatidylinositol 4,5-bisphosphate phosphodiesterase beta-1-like [Salmo salar]